MQNADKADKSKTLGSYLDTTLQKKIFRDVRKESAAKIESAKTIVVHYSDKIIKNSSYPAKQLITYLEELSQKLQASANIDMLSTPVQGSQPLDGSHRKRHGAEYRQELYHELP